MLNILASNSGEIFKKSAELEVFIFEGKMYLPFKLLVSMIIFKQNLKRSIKKRLKKNAHKSLKLYFTTVQSMLG